MDDRKPGQHCRGHCGPIPDVHLERKHFYFQNFNKNPCFNHSRLVWKNQPANNAPILIEDYYHGPGQWRAC